MRHVYALTRFRKVQVHYSWAHQSASTITKRPVLPRSLGLVSSQIYAWPRAQQSVRGAKRKSTVDLESLPQGILVENADLKPLEKEVEDEVVYPTVIQQVRNNMRKFNDCVILTRVGGFYEV